MNWRPEDWDKTSFNLGFATPYKSTDGRLLAFGDGVEAGADAMLDALFKMAEESPTKTFTIDSQNANTYEAETGTLSSE